MEQLSARRRIRIRPVRATGDTMRAAAQILQCVASAWLALGIVGCSTLTPGATAIGTPIETVRHGIAAPTGEYKLPDGGTRLEFAQGSFGKQTWMLDFDAGGHLVASQQVLTEANFGNIAPGMSANDVKMRLGRPANVFNVSWQQLQVWNYRFATGDCVWFQVSLSQAGRVTESSIGSDPACDGPNDRE
jgi:hypothetical protein